MNGILQNPMNQYFVAGLAMDRASSCLPGMLSPLKEKYPHQTQLLMDTVFKVTGVVAFMLYARSLPTIEGALVVNPAVEFGLLLSTCYIETLYNRVESYLGSSGQTYCQNIATIMREMSTLFEVFNSVTLGSACFAYRAVVHILADMR